MKRKVNVKRHLRKTKKGLVPVRQHSKKVKKSRKKNFSSSTSKKFGRVSEEEQDYLRETYNLEPWEIPDYEAEEAIQERRDLLGAKKLYDEDHPFDADKIELEIAEDTKRWKDIKRAELKKKNNFGSWPDPETDRRLKEEIDFLKYKHDIELDNDVDSNLGRFSDSMETTEPFKSYELDVLDKPEKPKKSKYSMHTKKVNVTIGRDGKVHVEGLRRGG